MKALEILNELLNEKHTDEYGYSYKEEVIVEAIEELEALKYNYEAQEIVLKDKEMWIRGLESKLEYLQVPKTCEWCKYEDTPSDYWVCCMCSRNVSDKYEPKENYVK